MIRSSISFSLPHRRKPNSHLQALPVLRNSLCF